MPTPATPRDWRDALGVALSEARLAAGLTQLDLGLEVSRSWRGPVHHNTISKLERGLTNFTLELFVDVVNEIGGDVAGVFKRADELLATAATGSIDEPPNPNRGPLHFERGPSGPSESA